LLTEFADKPVDALLLRLPILWGVTLALLTEFVDKPVDALLLHLGAWSPIVTCAET